MTIYQVDAFTDHVFGGNPAAVIPLTSWIPDETMQQIAMENNLSETAFFVRKGDTFHIRWFTPEIEIDLCGHATLASAHVIFHYLGHSNERIQFSYSSGTLSVEKTGHLLCMDFPSIASEPTPVTDEMVAGLQKTPLMAKEARDLLVLFESERDIAELEPNFSELSKLRHLGIIATAPGDSVDFVSRFFAPNAGINEDPVTGSAHCMLIPFWAQTLGKNKLEAIQLSSRVGKLSCEFKEERVLISGHAVTYMIGKIDV